jgi:hypothetical protein
VIRILSAYLIMRKVVTLSGMSGTRTRNNILMKKRHPADDIEETRQVPIRFVICPVDAY